MLQSMNPHPSIPFSARLAAVALAAVGLSSAQPLPTAKTLAADMGMGWNLGNTMELINVQPIPTATLFDSVKAAGFKTVRIPAAWDMHADQTTRVIDPAWMAQVKKVVDYAIQDSLYVVLNIHWDGGWIEGKIDSAATRPAMLATMRAKQGAYWKQIATTFRDYGRHLLFASANEPGVDDRANLHILMGLHQIFIDTVRATGGNNASRTLILPGPSTSFEHTSEWVTELPKDVIADRLMVEAHFYPYQFCLMSQPTNWGSPFYYWGKGFHSTTDPAHNSTWGEEAYVDSQFNLMKPKFLDKNIPVLVGEFGAMKRLSPTGDNLRLAILSRRHFYNYVTKAAISRGMIPVAWDAGGKGDGTMTIFDRRQEGAIYDLGLLNAMRAGAGLAKLPGDTSSDYSVASGANAMRILYSAKDSGFGQVNLGVLKGDLTAYDSVLVRAHVKGTTRYDSAGVAKNGFASISLITMSKNWTWREASLGALSFDTWKTYAIALSSDTSARGALVPADPAKIDFFAMQAYSHAYRGALYIDWIGYKRRNGTIDTVYTFNEKAPEEGTGNINTIQLVPVSSVETDDAWLTSTTSKWGTTRVAPRTPETARSLRLTASEGFLRASFHAESQGSGVATLRTLDGVVLWSRQIAFRTGANVMDIPASHRGTALLTIRGEGLERTGKVVMP